MDRRVAIASVAVVAVGIGLVALLLGSPLGTGGAAPDGVDTFDGPEEFESYVEDDRSSGGTGLAAGDGGAARAGPSADGGDGSDAAPGGDGDASQAAGSAESSSSVAEGGSGVRRGTSNVQEDTVDEPDVVKTGGRHFYVAERRHDRRRRAGGDDSRESSGTTHVVDASDPADPRDVGDVNASGRLLVVGDSLVVLEGDRVVGYDVSTPGDPERTWSRDLNGSLVTARATGGQVYLVVSSRLRESPSCPVEPLEGASVSCGDIYRPDEPVPVDATYAALAVDPASGAVTDSVGFVGAPRRTTVYMSPESLYVTYTDPIDHSEVTTSALLAAEGVPTDVQDRLREIRSYDLSDEAARIEIRRTVNGWLGSLEAETSENVRENLSESMDDYVENRSREFTTTGIVRVAVGDGLDVAAHGTVPGRPLNQFSLDEYDGRLRIATTVPSLGDGASENDLYTLDAGSLDRIGAVQGMGEDQRIFAARFVDETAYLVTFRRVDPFHVVDLSDPAEPVEQGVKELPGFSTYLHPIDEDHVLGIGEEDGRVKTVLFDVSDPSDPTIADSKVYDRRWSDVANSHHAFTIDRRHGVFFLPAEGDGLVVDYTDSSLSVETTVDAGDVRRARYVGDYLYVFGQREITVLDESTWNRTATLALD